MRVANGRHGTMDILGKVSGGVVVLKDPEALPEGTVVRVEPVGSVGPSEAPEPSEAEEERKEGPTIWDKLRDLAGTVKGLPPDFARNHDHYIHGRPKE
jgi:hypothetical protein